jgi:hypothetical protein
VWGGREKARERSVASCSGGTGRRRRWSSGGRGRGMAKSDGSESERS